MGKNENLQKEILIFTKGNIDLLSLVHKLLDFWVPPPPPPHLRRTLPPPSGLSGSNSPTLVPRKYVPRVALGSHRRKSPPDNLNECAQPEVPAGTPTDPVRPPPPHPSVGVGVWVGVRALLLQEKPLLSILRPPTEPLPEAPRVQLYQTKVSLLEATSIPTVSVIWQCAVNVKIRLLCPVLSARVSPMSVLNNASPSELPDGLVTKCNRVRATASHVHRLWGKGQTATGRGEGDARGGRRGTAEGGGVG